MASHMLHLAAPMAAAWQAEIERSLAAAAPSQMGQFSAGANTDAAASIAPRLRDAHRYVIAQRNAWQACSDVAHRIFLTYALQLFSSPPRHEQMQFSAFDQRGVVM
ncbi:hypothetical protein [Variovorax sp. RA8]|uniref:hypothetical protein n=1 Tax=Variovorax sp. (strain JCM 16519 / RA8) TaxID=662548 RepID=UPI0013A5A92A|nr:hypothetical protein [Variovorax sp. RA8]